MMSKLNKYEHGGGGCSCTVKFEHVQDGGEGPCTVMSKLNKYENVGEGQSPLQGVGVWALYSGIQGRGQDPGPVLWDMPPTAWTE